MLWDKVRNNETGRVKKYLALDVVAEPGTKFKYDSMDTKFPPNSRGNTKGAFSGFTSPFKASASYGWTDDGKLNVKIHYVDWMCSVKLQLDFVQNRITFQENYKRKASLLRFK